MTGWETDTQTHTHLCALVWRHPEGHWGDVVPFVATKCKTGFTTVMRFSTVDAPVERMALDQKRYKIKWNKRNYKKDSGQGWLLYMREKGRKAQKLCDVETRCFFFCINRLTIEFDRRDLVWVTLLGRLAAYWLKNNETFFKNHPSVIHICICGHDGIAFWGRIIINVWSRKSQTSAFVFITL